MNDIVINDADVLAQIINSTSLKEVKQLIAKINGVKVALKEAEIFRENSIKFAKLEAYALIKLVELGGINELKGHRKRVAEWLFGLSESDREDSINKCSDGLSIDQVWKSEILDNEKIASNLSEIRILEDICHKELQEDGIVDLSYIDDVVRKKIHDSTLANDMVRGLRDRIRKKGGVGVGHDSKIYVIPTSNNKPEVKKAIIMRFKSAVNDLESLIEIAKRSNTKVSYQDLFANMQDAQRKGYMVHLLLGLARTEIFDNEDELFERIYQEDINSEIKYVTEHKFMTEKQYLENRLSRLEN